MAQYQPYDPYEDEDDPLTDEIPPGANFGNNASGVINNQNPNANPDQPFVQEGTTGGYIDGIGVTVGQGSSITPAQAAAHQSGALAAGVPQDWIDSFLARNPGDTNRLIEAWLSDNGNAPANSGAGGVATPYTAGGSSGSSGGGGTGGGGTGGGTAASGDPALAALLSLLQTQATANTTRQEDMWDILREQLELDQEPISADSPGIREVLAGTRLGLQRGAERQRQGSAELRAYDGSGGLGGKAFESDVNRIDQQRAESDAMMTGTVLNRELENRQRRLTQRLALAMQLGDAESARLIQTQLQAIQTQLGQTNFYDSLHQDDSHFNDNSAFNYAALNQSGNLAALMAILGAA